MKPGSPETDLGEGARELRTRTSIGKTDVFAALDWHRRNLEENLQKFIVFQFLNG
jgi:hypothetical protein